MMAQVDSPSPMANISKIKGYKNILIEKIPAVFESAQQKDKDLKELRLKAWGKIIKIMQQSQITKVIAKAEANLPASRVFQQLIECDEKIDLFNSSDHLCAILEHRGSFLIAQMPTHGSHSISFSQSYYYFFLGNTYLLQQQIPFMVCSIIVKANNLELSLFEQQIENFCLLYPNYYTM